VQLDKTQHQDSVQLHRWRTQHRDKLISTQQQASKQKTAEHKVSAKLEKILGKLQQMLTDNAEAAVSRKSAEKERRTVEQTELQAAQEAQEAILHDIQTALDSISNRVTAIEETQQRDWQTQVQQHDKITKIQKQILQQQQVMHQCDQDALDMQAGEYNKNRQREQEAGKRHTEVLQRLHALEKNSSETKRQENTVTTLPDEHEVQRHSPSNATPRVDTDTGTVSAGAQHKIDKVDAPEKVADGKENEVTENDYEREHRAIGADTETETTGAHRKANEMNTDAETFRDEGIHTPTEDAQPHPADSTAAGTLEYSEILGIMKQMHERTTAQAALAHEQSEKVENKLSELTKKLDKVAHVMEEQQFNFTYSNKLRELRVDSNTQNLERVDGGETETEKVDQTCEIQKVTNTSVSYDNLENSISGETTTINVSEPIGQEHDTLTWLIGSHVSNTSGENSTNQTHLDHIDTEDMFMKVLATNNCVVIILGCLNLIHAVKTGYKSIHMSGKIQITGMIVQMVFHFLSTHNNEITQMIQTWVVTGAPLIASF